MWARVDTLGAPQHPRTKHQRQGPEWWGEASLFLHSQGRGSPASGPTAPCRYRARNFLKVSGWKSTGPTGSWKEHSPSARPSPQGSCDKGCSCIDLQCPPRSFSQTEGAGSDAEGMEPPGCLLASPLSPGLCSPGPSHFCPFSLSGRGPLPPAPAQSRPLISGTDLCRGLNPRGDPNFTPPAQVTRE